MSLCVSQDLILTKAQGQPRVSDSLANKFLCITKGGNARLGNRFSNQYGLKYYCCPACKIRGVKVKLNEAHVIFSCPAVSGQRLGLGLSMSHEILQASVGGESAPRLY